MVNLLKKYQILSLMALSTYQKYKSVYSPTSLDGKIPIDLARIASLGTAILKNTDESFPRQIYTFNIFVAYKKNLVTKPLAESILKGCKEIEHSVDHQCKSSILKFLESSHLLDTHLLRQLLVVGLTNRFIVKSIEQQRLDIVSPEEYKLVDPLVQREFKHGDNYIQYVLRVLVKVYELVGNAVNGRYCKFARGSALISSIGLKQIINNLNLYLGG